MFPLALFLLTKAYQETQSRTALVLMALIAASIKLVDLFLPGLPPIRTFNPAMAILIEGIVAAFVVPQLVKSQGIMSPVYTVAANFGWRIAFLTYVFILSSLGGFPIKLIQSNERLFSFLLLEAAIGSLLSYGLWLLQKKSGFLNPSETKRPYLWALPLLAGAIVLQVFV
jgi:hypothetical protein